MARRLWLFAVTSALVLSSAPRLAYAGYTHYWTWHAAPAPEALARCVDEMSAIVESRRDLLADEDERTGKDAIFTASHEADGDADLPRGLFFNGIGLDAHEPFVFPGRVGFNFTKTAYKKYDEVVTACLIVAHDHFPPPLLEIASDGAWEDGDWAAGALLYSAVMKRPANNPVRPFVAPEVDPTSAKVLVRATEATDVRRNWLISGGVLLLAVVSYALTRTRKRRWP